MIIGTMRTEEAQAFNSEEGYHSFHDEHGAPYGSFEVFWCEGEDNGEEDSFPAGWYWWAGFPGCVPDSDAPTGPFSTSIRARLDADEYWSGE